MTDGDYKHTLGIVRDLGQSGIQVSVVAKSKNELASCSRYCTATHFAPRATEPGYVDAILEILKRNPQDLLMPVGYAATVALAARKSELAEYTKLQIAEHQQIVSAGDKKCVQELAASLDLPTPKTYCPNHIKDVRHQSRVMQYPVVVKPRRESPGVTVRHVSSSDELLSIWMKGLSDAELPMIQEFIPGYGCGFFALYQRGACKRVFMHRRVRENPPGGGASCCAESFYDPLLKEYGIRILNKLGWHGVAMVEFRHDSRDQEFKILEVNPKFWGSLDLSLAAGVHFPHDLCEMAEGKELEYSEDYQRPLRFHWPLSGEAQHCFSRPSSFGSILADSLNPRVRSNIWMRDFRPNWRESLSLIRSGWKKGRKP